MEAIYSCRPNKRLQPDPTNIKNADPDLTFDKNSIRPGQGYIFCKILWWWGDCNRKIKWSRGKMKKKGRKRKNKTKKRRKYFPLCGFTAY